MTRRRFLELSILNYGSLQIFDSVNYGRDISCRGANIICSLQFQQFCLGRRRPNDRVWAHHLSAVLPTIQLNLFVNCDAVQTVLPLRTEGTIYGGERFFARVHFLKTGLSKALQHWSRMEHLLLRLLAHGVVNRMS
jgi:hypothetical protein